MTHAEPHTCPRCFTVTWSRNLYVIRCRICDHVWQLPPPERE